MKKLLVLPVVLLAWNASAQVIKARSNEVTVDFASAAPVASGEKPINRHERKYKALIMGVSDYKNSSSKLPALENPVKDAQRIYDVLVENYTFEAANVTLLENPTRQEIIDALENLSTTVSDNDNLFVFYAGHGYYDKGKELGFWLPSDAKIESKSDWIANSTIKDYLKAINSKHTLLVTDACFGGSIFKTRAVDASTIIKINELYRETSRKAMTSGNLSEVPDKSIFLQQFVKKLRDNEDEFLPSQKLFSRIYEPVTNNSTSNPQFGVIQGSGDEGGDFIFIKRHP